MFNTLIVDGQLSDRHFLASLLGFFGHHVLQAEDGVEALPMVREQRPDLVISDVLMRTTDGYEMVREFRSDHALADIPVIWHVPRCYQSEARAAAPEYAVGHILTKPASLETVVRTVHLALSVEVPADVHERIARFEKRQFSPPSDPIDARASVFIVEDDPQMLRVLSTLISGTGLKVRMYRNAEDFLNDYRDTAGCLLLDLNLPDTSGIAVLEALRARRMQIPAIFLTGRADLKAAQRAIRLRALDFLEKSVPPRTMLARIYYALQEDSVDRRRRAEREAILTQMASLTEREWELLHHLIDGQASKQIAAELHISIRTVANHRSNLMAKTGAVNVADLVRMSMIARDPR